MLFGWFYFDWTILIVLPAILFASVAQLKVKSTFEKYAKLGTYSGLTGAEAARRLLNSKGLYHVNIVRTEGSLTDHYDPRDKTLYLSREVHDFNTVSAIGVACHEAGHAIQHEESYAPLHIRMALVPVCNFGSRLAMPLFIIGMFLAVELGYIFMVAGILCFSVATLFQLVTLPVEFNASRRALEGMTACGLVNGKESDQAKEVLSAAAMTYVAALATSLLSLLRLIIIANNRRDR